MKKMIKKAIACAMAFAMVATTAVTNIAKTEVKADDYSCKLYFKVPDGATAGEFGVNSWGEGVTPSGATGTVVVTPWNGEFPALTDEGNGFGSITLTATGAIQGVQFVKADGTGYTDGIWNTQIQAQGLTEAYFNTADSKWYKESSFATEILAPVLDEIFYVVGAEGMIGEGWGWNTDNGLMSVVSEGVQAVTFSRIPDGTYEFKIVQDPKDFGWDNQIVDDALKIDNGNMAVTADNGVNDITITLDVATKAVTAAVVKSPINGADVVEMIATLPAVEDITLADEAAVAAVEAAYEGLSDAEKANVTNYDVLVALRAKLDELQQAADDAANVILHFENALAWETVNAYAFNDDGALLGDWPGKEISANANNEGWYSFKLSCAADFTVIFNGSGKQTVNTDITVAADGVTEAWITMTGELAEPDEFGNANYATTVVTEAPEGWTEGEIEEIIPEDPEVPEEDEEEVPEDEETEEEDVPTAWDDAALKIHVLMPEIENWEKLGLYLFGTGENFGWTGGAGELTGAWPGAELKLENDSETWYAFGGTFADGHYMAIINNFVSDAEAAEGAVKAQAKDLELTDGEYWIVLEVAEDGSVVANVSEEAPENYDGTGLDEIVEGDTPEDTKDDETANGGTGDALPFAVATVAMVAGAALVVSRKRKVA